MTIGPKVEPDREYILSLQCSFSKSLFVKLGLHNCVSKEQIKFDHSSDRIYVSLFSKYETYIDIFSHLKCLTVYSDNYIISNSKKCIVAIVDLCEKKLKENLNNELNIWKIIIPDNSFEITRANIDDIKLLICDALDCKLITKFYSAKSNADVISEINN